MDNNNENVDSGNSEDFVMTIESCTSKERHSEPEKYSFEVLTPDQIVQHMMDIIREVTTVIGVNEKISSNNFLSLFWFKVFLVFIA